MHVLSLALSCIAVVHAVASTATAQHAAPAFRGDSTTVRVPLEPGMRPVVIATINGKGPFRLLVETGAVVSYLLPDAFDRLAAPGDNQPASIRTDSVRLGSTAIAHGLRFNRIPSLGLTDIDGLLGLDAFRATLTTVDFPKSELRLAIDTLPDANGRDIVKLGQSIGFWTVPVVFPGDTVDAIIDTQSAYSISGAPALTQTLRFTTAPVTVGRARGPSVGNVAVQQARLDGSMRIGDAELVQPIVDLVSLPAPLPADKYILGLQVLRNFSITLDQRTGRARFARSDRKVPAPPPIRSTGMASTARPDGTRIVTHVIAGLPAIAAGIQERDVIVSVNGRPTGEFTETEWRGVTMGASLIRFRIRRDTTVLDVSLTPALVGF